MSKRILLLILVQFAVEGWLNDVHQMHSLHSSRATPNLLPHGPREVDLVMSTLGHSGLMLMDLVDSL
jgi:hypothetical protein